MIASRHALRRLAERFPHLDMESEFARAKRMGYSTRRKLKLQVPERAKQMTRVFKGTYYVLSKSRVVFVCAPPEFVITVFPLTGNTDWKSRPIAERSADNNQGIQA